MRELWLQMWHDILPNAKSKFVTKGKCFLLLFFVICYLFVFFFFFRWEERCYLEQNFTNEKSATAKRGPLRDEDCYWDYGKARCAWAQYCEYRLKLL